MNENKEYTKRQQKLLNNLIIGNILIDNCNPLLCPKGEDHTGNTWPLRPELIMPDPQISSNSGCLSDYNIFFRTDGTTRSKWDGLYHTAGPYEAPKEFMKFPEKKTNLEARLKPLNVTDNLVEMKGPLNPGEGVQFRSLISRDDGTVIP